MRMLNVDIHSARFDYSIQYNVMFQSLIRVLQFDSVLLRR